MITEGRQRGRPKGSKTHPRIEGYKWCFVCQQYKLVDKFYKSSVTSGGVYPRCKSCEKKGTKIKSMQEKLELKKRKKEQKQFDWLDVALMRAKGMTLESIGEFKGLSRQRVYQILIAYYGTVEPVKLANKEER